MKKYKVMLEGRNFLINYEGKIEKLGFLTTRFVEADDPKDAELKAVQLIKEDERLLAAVQNKNKENSPMIYLDSIDRDGFF
jgi:hypothetical protein